MNQFRSSISGMRRNSVSAAPVSGDRLKDWAGPPVFAKSPEEFARIQETIKNSGPMQVLFGHFADAEIDKVVGAFFARDVEFGEIVIEQGADGDYFYIVDGGVYDIFVQRHPELQAEKVMVAQAGMSFGELALMYSVPRAATVRCAERGRLWCLDRECFQMMLITGENTKQREHQGFLSQIEILQPLTSYELARVSDLLTSELFDQGEDIVRQGEEDGAAVYFLYEGECKAFINGERGEIEVKHYVAQGEYFGEIALITNEPRRATVRACGDGCVVLKLSRGDVDLSVGCVQDRLLAEIARYPLYEAYG